MTQKKYMEAGISWNMFQHTRDEAHKKYTIQQHVSSNFSMKYTNSNFSMMRRSVIYARRRKYSIQTTRCKKQVSAVNALIKYTQYNKT